VVLLGSLVGMLILIVLAIIAILSPSPQHTGDFATEYVSQHIPDPMGIFLEAILGGVVVFFGYLAWGHYQDQQGNS
jgi:hypothetical protein